MMLHTDFSGRSAFCAILLLWATAPTLAAPEAALSPGMQTYSELQATRNRIGPAIYGGETVLPEAAREILDDIGSALTRLDSPLANDLSWGVPPLASQRVNLLCDRLRLQFRLGDRDAAARTWRELQSHFWMPTETISANDKALDTWLKSLSDPLLHASKAASRLGNYSETLLTPHALSREERILGLTTIWSAARMHFVWFDHVPNLDWDRAYLSALPHVIAAPTEAAYWRELMRFTAQLKDGHSNAYPPERLTERLWAQPGLRTARLEGRVVIVEVTDPQLRGRVQVGDEVVTIDGLSVKTYASRYVAPFQSSSTPQDHDVRTYGYSLLGGDATRPVRLRLRDRTGRTYEVVATRSGWQADQERPDTDFTLRADGIAVLTSRQFEDDAAGKLMAAHVDEVMSAKGLILDLRGNGGGSSLNGLELLRWLTHRSLPAGKSRRRLQDPMLVGKPVIAWQPIVADTVIDPASRIYDGPVALLVDAQTFSAAEDTVATFQLMQRGAIIGVPTAGSTGQPIVLALPGGGMVRICAKRDEYPDGTSFVGTGIIPDHIVPTTLADIRNGNDPVLAQAVAWLLTDRH